jgi:polysaccharide export outer membrane protein
MSNSSIQNRALKAFIAFGLAGTFQLAAQPAPPSPSDLGNRSSLAAQPAPPSDAVNRSSYVLGPNDQLKIWALGVDEITDKPIRIDPSGDIDLPLVGKVHAAGLTMAQLNAELVQRFSKDIRHPQVSIEILDFGSQPVSLLGAVNHPGVHQLEGHKTLTEVLSLGEGLRPDAGARINISRQIRYGAIPLPNAKLDPTGNFSVADVGVHDLLAGIHPAENIVILPNDVITVPTAETIYVIGEVKKPGEVMIKTGGVTVLQALSTANGFASASAPQKSKIIRITPGTAERVDIPVDLNKILAGKAEDIAMRPNDILVVPSSVPKKAGTRALEAAVQAATGIAIWGRY